ncbi:MAG: zinc metallopeptidase [Chromatiales bacterium]|jgi:uncharacterized protein|nr:zinc metallopeptidase [Chromatiales bacterium]
MIFILYIGLLALAYVPWLWVRAVMRMHGKDVPGMPGTGGELATHLLALREMDVKVERGKEGEDHYDPIERTVRLSPSNFDGRSITAVAVATHEVGHAIQHYEGHAVMAIRNAMYGRVKTAETIAIAVLSVAPVLGFLFRNVVVTVILLLAAVALFFSRVIMHVVTLPLEWDASFGKALPIIEAGNYVAPEERVAVRRVLRAAALTYVAGALADVLSIWRWLLVLRRGF